MRHSGVWALALVGLALAFRLTLAIGFPNDEPDDGKVYALLAHNLVTAGVYSADDTPPLTPTYVRVPGYPAFIAIVYRAFGDNNNTAVPVNCMESDATWNLVLTLFGAPSGRPEGP